MNKHRSYAFVVLGLAALAITLAATRLGPNEAQAAAPGSEPVPFQQAFWCTIPAYANDLLCQSQTYTVPAGKRLVVEYVSGRASIPAGANMTASLELGAVPHTLALGNPQMWGLWENSRAVSQQMLGFAEAGTTVHVDLHTDNSLTYQGNIYCVVTGHLVSL